MGMALPEGNATRETRVSAIEHAMENLERTIDRAQQLRRELQEGPIPDHEPSGGMNVKTPEPMPTFAGTIAELPDRINVFSERLNSQIVELREMLI